MAIFELQGPDGQVYEVDAPDEASALQAFQGMGGADQPQPEGGYGSQIFSGLLEGATGALGAPVDLVNNLLVAPAAAGINYAFGTDIQPSQTPLGGSAGLRQGLAISPESQSGGEQFARRVAQSVGGCRSICGRGQ
ncbi:structural protein [Brucella phage EF4]|uniref:Structural protein n=1 Tax=Brucella phage EF4 TaxID=2706778 RepID=A0A6C0X1M0_9CAUD|nr:structural protein [Brucella phage EF4]